MKQLAPILLLVLFYCVPGRADQLPIRTYTTADGLARDSVHKIVSDPRGYLWFCTSDGLSRFDGYEFVNYNVAQGLPHRVVLDLLITRSGDYWLATQAGLVRFNPFAPAPDAKFKTYVPTQRPASEIINSLYQDSAGTIWISTGNGLYTLRQNNGDWQLDYVTLGEKTDKRLDISSTVADSAGALWIGSEHGLFRRFPDGKIESFSEKDGLPHPHIRDILKDSDGTIWLATGRGLCRLAADIRPGQPIVANLYTKKDGLLSDSVVALLRTSSGSLWLASPMGLSQFSPEPLPNGGHFVNYTRAHGLSDPELRALAEDHDGDGNQKHDRKRPLAGALPPRNQRHNENAGCKKRRRHPKNCQLNVPSAHDVEGQNG